MTQRQADSALGGFVHEVAKGNIPLGRSTTLAEYLERWIDHITPTRSPTTIRGYKFEIARVTERLGRLCRSPTS